MRKTGFIGGGNMAAALIYSMLDSGADPALISVSDISDEKLQLFSQRGIYTTKDNSEAARRSDVIILAVKPQNMDTALASLRGAVKGRAVVSIAAGVCTEKIKNALEEPLVVVRVMPNTPMLLKKGVCAIAFCGADAEIRAEITGIFGSCGEVFEVTEDMMDTVTALSGSGPAYFYRFAEVLARTADSLGLDYETAVKMAAGTMAGAAEMIMKTGKTPAELIRDVSSPGGTTVAALSAFDLSGLDSALAEGLKAAALRSRELGKS